jgi:hypothetical protein
MRKAFASFRRTPGSASRAGAGIQAFLRLGRAGPPVFARVDGKDQRTIP